MNIPLIGGTDRYVPSGEVLHLKVEKYKDKFRFEWHPNAKRVYVIRASKPNHGDAIADDIATHGGAQMTILIWLRGYQEAVGELGAHQQPQ